MFRTFILNTIVILTIYAMGILFMLTAGDLPL